MMINIIFLLLCLFPDKDKPLQLPFLKVDTISSNSVLVHYKCAEKLQIKKNFIPVYKNDEYVGVGMCLPVENDGWMYAKVYLIKQIDDEYYLRANFKVQDSEFNQNGCYWQINDAYITRFVFVKNGSKY